jgi:hypothetical protein
MLALQKTEVWCRRFKVGEYRVVISSSPNKTVSATPFDRISWPWFMTPMNTTDETVLRLYGGDLVRLPCSLEEVLGWFG